MNRKEWLEKFLFLVDRNRPAIEFRKIGIKIGELSKHIKMISKYRKELKDILHSEIPLKMPKKEEKPAKTEPNYSINNAILDELTRESENLGLYNNTNFKKNIKKTNKDSSLIDNKNDKK